MKIILDGYNHSVANDSGMKNNDRNRKLIWFFLNI